MKKILVLDANSLLNRAFYGVRPLTTREGLPTNAVFGYLNIVNRYLETLKPDFAAAAFDLPAPTFRHRFSAAYKATRHPMPEELKAQLPYIRRATEALGIAVVEKEGYEADDILGTLSLRAENEGMEAALVTGDRDSYQLVSDKTTLFLASTGNDKTITPEVLLEEFGLSPAQLIDVKALAGDTSDNIPGVRGIGEKTAVQIIRAAGSLDEAYADPVSLGLGKAALQKLLDGKQSAYDSRFLAKIERQVPALPETEALLWQGIDREKMKPLFLELEFQKMFLKFGLAEEEKMPPREEANPAQGSLFDPVPEESALPPLGVIAPEAVPAEPILFFDGENFNCLDENGAPCRIDDGGDVSYLKTRRPVVPDAKAYYHALAARGVAPDETEVLFDLYLCAYVLDSREAGTTLSRLALTVLKEGVSPSLEGEPAYILPLMKRLYEKLSADLKQSEAEKLYFEIELPLAKTLAKMELCGFAVWREGLEKYGETLLALEKEAEARVFDFAGETFTVNSPKQLGHILFEKLGLPVVKKTKTGYATDAETLRKLRLFSPIIDAILDYRSYAKLRSTYVVGMLSQIREDGRIHTSFNQMQTATGRLSSAEPNLQNIPVKTELGRELRKFFVAKDENHVLVDADYSQIELRLLAHMSGDEALIKTFREGEDIHTRTAAEIFRVPREEVTPEMRKSAKAVNFGIVYGIGEYSLSQDIGVGIATAREYIKNYFALYPGVRRYLDSLKEQAKKDLFVTTLFGRRRYIPELKGPKKPLIAFGERVAMNTPIQGTAADLIKLAMVNVDRRLAREKMEARLILQVHDELILEAPLAEAEKAARILSEEMENAREFLLPLVAEAAVGASWFEAK